MVSLLTIVHVAVCIFLIAIVLLQHGKGADMGAAFGGGSSKTVFGSDGPLPLLNKITTASAIIFMLTSVTLAYYSANISKGSVMEAVRPAPPPIEQQDEIVPPPVEVPLSRSGEETTAPQEFPGDANATFPGATDPTAPTQVPEEEAPPASEADSNKN